MHQRSPPAASSGARRRGEGWGPRAAAFPSRATRGQQRTGGENREGLGDGVGEGETGKKRDRKYTKKR